MSVIPRPREVRPADAPPRPRSRLAPAAWWASSALGLAVFVTAYENGASGLTARAVIAIAVWWSVIVGVGLGFLPRTRLTTEALVAIGLLLGLTVTAAVALVSRLFPGLFSARGLPEFLPNAATRLSFPVGYWNG